MPFFHQRPLWQLSENLITPEPVFVNRRQLLQGLVATGVGLGTIGLTGCQSAQPANPDLAVTLNMPALPGLNRNPQFAELDRPLTAPTLAGQYNNFYEFGGTKDIWPKAQALSLDPWTVTIGGLVKTPKTYDLDDLKKAFPLEERLYRFRCVEAWSMAVPWAGFPMQKLLAAVEPTAAAKYVRFISYYDAKVMPGPGFYANFLPWPYTEGLRLDEMANELAFFAVGIYGHDLPKQHGAPLRAVIPWKYGFKGAKSIVKIEFVADRPKTYWNTLQANEYGFEANVNPKVPHPRWSQSKERFIGAGPNFSWEEKPTLLYNGYGEYVASLYT